MMQPSYKSACTVRNLPGRSGLWLSIAAMSLMQLGCGDKVSEDSIVKQQPVQIQYVPVIAPPVTPVNQVPPVYTEPRPVWKESRPPQGRQVYHNEPERVEPRSTGNPWAASAPAGQAGYEAYGAHQNAYADQYGQARQAAPATRFRPLENRTPPQPATPATVQPMPNAPYGWVQPPYVAPYDRPIGSSRSPAGVRPGVQPGYGGVTYGAGTNAYSGTGYGGGYATQPGYYGGQGYYGSAYPMAGLYPGGVSTGW